MSKFIRKVNRLPFKPIYQSNNSFFVTICVQDRIEIFDNMRSVEEKLVSQFSDPENRQINLSPTNEIDKINLASINKISKINLSKIGEIVQNVWLSLPELFENIVLDEFVIMPNHFHGIITFLDLPISRFTQKESSLGKIIKYFKTKSTLKTKELLTKSVTGKLVSPQSESKSSENDELKFMATKKLIENYGTIWQKSFYDHIIRSEPSFQKIQKYIQNNPQNWELDLLNPINSEKFQAWTKNKSE